MIALLTLYIFAALEFFVLGFTHADTKRFSRAEPEILSVANWNRTGKEEQLPSYESVLAPWSHACADLGLLSPISSNSSSCSNDCSRNTT